MPDYLKNSVEYDADIELNLDFSSASFQEMAELEINLEGAASTDYGVLEIELEIGNSYLDFEFLTTSYQKDIPLMTFTFKLA